MVILENRIFFVRYSKDTYIGEQNYRIGSEFCHKTETFFNRKIKIQMWDFQRHPVFENNTPTYFRGAHIVFLCFDLTNPQSFYNIDKWVLACERYNERAAKIGIGLKSDLPRKMPRKNITEYCFSKNIRYFEVSSKIILELKIHLFMVAI